MASPLELLGIGVHSTLWNNYPDGWYGIYRYDPDNLVMLAEASSSAIKQGSATNAIQVERNGAAIKVSANGQVLTSITDGTYSGSRYLGLIVFSYNQPNVDVRFDNFVVNQINCWGASSSSITPAEWLGAPGAFSVHALTGKEKATSARHFSR